MKYKYITEEELAEAVEVAENFKILGIEERKAVKIYMGALKDRMMLVERPAKNTRRQQKKTGGSIERRVIMPKVKPTDTEEKNRIVRACIAKNMELQALKDDDVALKLCIVKRTFQLKKKRPETFTLGELRKIATVLKLSNEEKLMLL